VEPSTTTVFWYCCTWFSFQPQPAALWASMGSWNAAFRTRGCF